MNTPASPAGNDVRTTDLNDRSPVISTRTAGARHPRIAALQDGEYRSEQAGRATASWEAPSHSREDDGAMRPTAARAAMHHAPGRRRGALAVALAAATLLFGACSSDDTSGEAASKKKDSTTTTTVAADGAETTTTVADAAGPTTEAPSAGELAVPGIAGATLDPVAMDQPAEFGNGVTAKITSIEATDAEASMPGETSGPAVQVTVEVVNGTGGPIDLSSVTVDLLDPTGASYTQVTTEAATPFAGQLDAGGTTTGSYLFRIAPEERADVRLTVKYSSDTPIAVFTGSVPNA